jgi:uncharacterized membrane protein
MHKNLAVLASSIIFLILVAPSTLAASIDLSVSTGQQPPGRISSCPDTVLSDIDVQVTNLGGETDTVMLSLDWPADLGFIKPFQTLASGETAFVNPFWITLPFNLEPGIYHAKVTAKSSITADEVTKDIEIEVLRCRSVNIIVDDGFEVSCQETQEPVVYDIEVVNEGKWSETFDISASVDWAELSKSEITLPSEGSETVSLVLNPPAGISSGTHTVFVTARSTESYATASASVEVEVIDCFDFSASLDPESQSACLGEGRDYELTINNIGDEDDEFTIDVPEWVFPDNTRVAVNAGDSGIIELTVVPTDKGIQTFEVTIASERDPLAASKKLSGIINVEECRGVAVIVAPTEATVCKGESVEFSVSIKNTGSLEGTFDLTTTAGDLSTNSITLDEGESTTIELNVNTRDMDIGKAEIEVKAAEGQISDSASIDLEVEECFVAELSVQPDSVVVCPGASIPYTMKLQNTGKKSDTYTLNFADQTLSVELSPGESETLSHDFQIPFVEEGRYLFNVDLTSEGGISISTTSEIELRSSEACFGVKLDDGIGVVDIGKATMVDIGIKNTGEQANNFKVSMSDAPDWAYLEPSEIHLGAQDEDLLYLYLSPGFGTPKGSHTITVSAESERASDSIQIVISIPEDIGEVPTEPPVEPPTEPEEPEEPEEPANNVSINVTHPAEPPPITGEAVEERPFWKTAAVAVIALIIVVILVLRFVLLFKK